MLYKYIYTEVFKASIDKLAYETKGNIKRNGVT